MRYFFQAIVMLSDLMIIAACALVLFYGYTSPIAWVVVASGFYVWYDSGGFMAWQPENIKKFFRNVGKYGL